MTTTSVDPKEVIEFWFGDIADDGSVAPETSQRWWKKDPDFDAEIANRFGPSIEAAERGALDDWLDDPQSALALVILLDQFTRNTRRDQAAMYAADAKARSVVRHCIGAGHPDRLRSMQVYFLWMPLMHSEALADQLECIERFEALAKNCEPGAVGAVKAGLDYAIKHKDIVERFGRFPHRNEILGRESTPEEQAFLQTPGSSF